DGRVIDQYASTTEPMGRTLTQAVEAALAAKA
nr:glutathione peroxidase [Stutzerimonas stutzeri]